MKPAPQADAAARLDDLLHRFEPPIRKLVNDARAKLRTLMPTALELVYSNRNAVAIGFASSERRGDWIVSLAIYTRGVNLYFIYGVALDDPHGLLQGSGNQGRFVRLESVAMLDRPEILALIEGAIKEVDTPLPKRGRGHVVTKSVSVPKARPRNRAAARPVRTLSVLCLAAVLGALAAQAQDRPRILIDASRDGGVWWAPQVRDFDARRPHQGKALADFLKRQGADVEELPRTFQFGRAATRSEVVTAELLSGRDLVVRAGVNANYTDIRMRVLGADYPAGEIGAYRDYVGGGGRLLLLSDHLWPNQTDAVAESFGIRLAGISTGENRIDRFVTHPITRNVTSMPYRVGSGLVGTALPGMTVLGFLSPRTYLDLDRNNARDPGEPAAAGVLGVVEFGKGLVVFMGDLNTLQTVPQPLTRNIYEFLVGPR